MKTRTRADIREAVRRIAGEQLQAIEALASLIGVPPATLRRWAIDGVPDGRGGRAFLDAVHRPPHVGHPHGWLTSLPALSRLLAAVESSARSAALVNAQAVLNLTAAAAAGGP